MKFIKILLVLLVLITLSSCKNGKENSENNSSEIKETKRKKITPEDLTDDDEVVFDSGRTFVNGIEVFEEDGFKTFEVTRDDNFEEMLKKFDE